MKQGMFLAIAIVVSSTSHLKADLIVDFEDPAIYRAATVVPVAVSFNRPFPADPSLLTVDKVTQRIATYQTTQRFRYPVQKFDASNIKSKNMTDLMVETLGNVNRPDEIGMMLEPGNDILDFEVLFGNQATAAIAFVSAPATNKSAKNGSMTNSKSRASSRLLSGAALAIPGTSSIAALGIAGIGMVRRRQKEIMALKQA